MKKNYQNLTVIILLLIGLLSMTDNLFAASTTALNPATSSAKPLKLAQREINQKTKAAQEIDRRTTSLNSLISRISEMKKLSDTEKNQLSLQATDQIMSLSSLKVKISDDEDQSSLKIDRQAIYNQYRIYLMFIPKIQILAAADRINEILSDTGQMISKLQDRISKDKLAGKDVTSLQSTMTDLQNKLADATLQVKTAQDLATPLVPDQGDLVIAKSNLETLKNARNKLVTAKKDLADIMVDIQKIRAGLIKIEKNNIATPSANR